MAERDLPVGNVTFLFTDIEGSTRLLQSLGRDEYSTLLDQHNKLFRDIAADAVVSTEGDSFFLVFSTPMAALTIAIGLQQALHDHEWPSAGTVSVRMGIHTGEGVLGGDNYVGLDVHRAARISAAAHGGQILVSDATRAQIAPGLPEQIGLRDLGEHRLKDLAHPEHLYQVTIAGLREEFPVPKSVEAAPTNLPEHLTAFVGREAELEAVLEALTQARLVTLTGTGGAGKTRLSIEAGRASSLRYLGGTFFAALGKIDDPDLLASHVAAEMAVPEQVGRSIEATLIDHLQPRQALLILDNCEHLADAAAVLVEHLLQHCSQLTVLATSREALSIAGEQLFVVGPMSLPGPEAEIGQILAADAVRLFVARASEVSPGFDAKRWARECVEICARLDGIPLAIELAAARSGMLTPADILSRLEDRFTLLTSRSRTAAPHHQTLEAAIDWSYNLLDNESRRLLRSLAVFRGGFTIEAVAQVCFADPDGEDTVLDHLTELRDKSLLTLEATFSESRYGLLETIREYADIRFHREGEFEAAALRHRDYFTGLARRESKRLAGSDQLSALAALEADHDNFRAVIRRTLEEGDIDSAADMAGWLVWFWYIHAHFTEGERWAGRLLDSLPDNPDRPWLRLLLGAAQFDYRIGHYERAEVRLQTALRWATTQNIPRMQMWSHAYLATNDLYRTDVEAGRREAELAVTLAEHLGDFPGLAYATFLLLSFEAWVSELEGKLHSGRAEELLNRLAPISAGARVAGDRNIIGHVLQLEGILSSRMGDHERASAAFDEAVTALTELGTVGCASHCLEAVAEYLAASGRHGEAAQLIGATDSLRAAVGIIVAPVEERFRAGATSLFRAALPADVLAREVDAGSALSLVEAAQLARQTLAQAGH